MYYTRDGQLWSCRRPHCCYPQCQGVKLSRLDWYTLDFQGIYWLIKYIYTTNNLILHLWVKCQLFLHFSGYSARVILLRQILSYFFLTSYVTWLATPIGGPCVAKRTEVAHPCTIQSSKPSTVKRQTLKSFHVYTLLGVQKNTEILLIWHINNKPSFFGFRA